VRPKSIKKEVEKQNLIERRVVRDLQRYGQKRTHRQVLYRVRQRFKSIAVGIKSGGNSPVVSQCWANGFRLLRGLHASPTQLRDLDRHRVNTLKAIRYHLVHLDRRVRRARRKAGLLGFEGFPFSYAQLGRGEGAQGMVERVSLVSGASPPPVNDANDLVRAKLE
jgi:hypothetical protein